MTTYVTAFSRSLTAYSYMIGTMIQKLFSRTHISNFNHCGQSIGSGGTNHCGAGSYEPPKYTNHCGQPIGNGYRGHC